MYDNGNDLASGTLIQLVSPCITITFSSNSFYVKTNVFNSSTLQVKGYLNTKQTKQTTKNKRHARHKDRKFLDALATDKFYLEKMIKHFSSDKRETSRGCKDIITEVMIDSDKVEGI